jgi:hypothetical protein
VKILQKILLFCAALAFIGIGFYIFCAGVNYIYLAHQSESWTETTGRVIITKVVCNSGSKGTRYNPEVVYGYEVSGIVYYNDHYSYGFGSAAKYGFIGGRKDVAEESLKQYEVGKSVPVFYNPENPEQSCLKPGGLDWGNGLPIFLGAFFSGGIIYIWRLKRSPNRRTYFGRRSW